MRSSTKAAVGVITLGVLGLSYQLGNAATVSSGNTFASPTDPAVASPEPSASASSSTGGTVVSPGSAGSEGVNPAPQPSASASSSPIASATKAPATAASKSETGDAIESGFGPVQVKVTKVGSKITDITYIQSVATHGRAAAFPYLVQYAIQANGSNFGNLSGATYTTNAFKQALESALAKF